MKNLAGCQANEQIILELKEAGIDIVIHERMIGGEPITNITGEFGALTFSRAWYYWVVFGPVYIEDAERMYATELGKNDIRCNGSCTCPPPLDCTTRTLKDVERMVDETIATFMDKEDLVHEDESLRKLFMNGRTVDLYHIDSQEGLNFFVQSLKDSKKWRYGPDERTNKFTTILSNEDVTVTTTRLPSQEDLDKIEQLRYQAWCLESEKKEAPQKQS